MESQTHNFLVIEGNIGAGKTSLAKKISDEFNAELILETFADNPFLPKFYEKPERYAFPLEMAFLADRYRQLNKELKSRNLFKSFTVSDYYFTKSLIFARNTLPDEEYKLYRKIFNIIHSSLPKPDLYVYLHRDTDLLLKNIKRRGRSYEYNISPDYLKKIQTAYFNYFKQEAGIPFLILDINKIDFLKNPQDYTAIKQAVFEKKYPQGISRRILS